MGWETRNGRRYYYEKKRMGGKVVSRYVSRGLAEFCEATNQLLAECRRTWRTLKAQEEEIDWRIDEVCEEIETGIRGMLFALGFHLHKGQWRKKRMSESALVKIDDNKLCKEAALEDCLERARYSALARNLLRQGDNPPLELVTQMRRILSQRPDLWREFGDLAKNETETLIRYGWKGDPAGQESVKMACENLKSDLGYEQSSPLERMAIEEVALAWVRLYEVQNRNTYFCHNRDGQGIHPETAEFWDRRLMYSQRRYWRAMEGLARVRKLSKGVKFVQINVAETGAQQINVAGDLVASQR